MWEYVKRALVDNAKEVCGSVRVGERVAWKKVLGARDEVAKDRCMEVYKEREWLKGIFSRAKRR